VYDFSDHEMMEALRPSIEEAQPIHSQNLALDYIGKRASQVTLRPCLSPTLSPVNKESSCQQTKNCLFLLLHCSTGLQTDCSRILSAPAGQDCEQQSVCKP